MNTSEDYSYVNYSIEIFSDGSGHIKDSDNFELVNFINKIDMDKELTKMWLRLNSNNKIDWEI